jgi:16S rRNA (guanine(966)-N(2))-methyltransferase RsmD
MRVIAGTLKGRRLSTPSWEGLRPTSDKLRETLFNVLAPRMAGARVVDGFAGTGAVGIEALSRGAAEVAFIDRDPRAVALIESNLAHCGIAGGYAIIRAPFERGVETLRMRPSFAPFDIVLLDPPYHQDSHADDIGRILEAAARVMAPGASLVLEHAKKGAPPQVAGPLTRARQIVSGDSALSFYAQSEA